MAFAEHEGFERPDCPKRHNHGEAIILANYALAALKFQLEVITEQTGIFLRVIVAE